MPGGLIRDERLHPAAKNFPQLAIASGRNFTTAGNFTNNGTLTVGSSNSTFDVNGNLTNFSGTTLAPAPLRATLVRLP